MIKGPTYKENIVIPNVYTVNYKASKYTKRKLVEFKGKTDKSPFTVGEVSVPHFVMSRTIIQKISKNIEELNEKISREYLIDIDRVLHPVSAENIFHTYGTSKINHILGNKTNISKFKRPKIISSMFSDHNGI